MLGDSSYTCGIICEKHKFFWREEEVLVFDGDSFVICLATIKRWIFDRCSFLMVCLDVLYLCCN